MFSRLLTGAQGTWFPILIGLPLCLLSGTAHSSSIESASHNVLSRSDALWLKRVTYGLDSADVSHLQSVGRLFNSEDGIESAITGFPQLSSQLYFDGVKPYLSVDTVTALDRATSQQEWNTFLLSSPEFNYR